MVPSPRRPLGPLCCFALGTLVLAAPVAAEEPLSRFIDQAIRARTADYDRVAAGRADDAEFLRRAALDLTGMIPPAADVRAFLADPAADRRVRLVDRLLASEDHARHLQRTFDVAWMDRRPAKHVKQADWEEYLRASFAANKPYDQLIREILSADGADPKGRAPARFALDRLGEPHLLTKDVSRLFLGMNLQCAQCHDHPLVDGFKQADYYGVFAFLNRTSLFTDKASKLAVLAEKAEGEVDYESVFVPKVKKQAGPRLPGGPALAEPTFAKGQGYVQPVKAGERGIPKFSRRARLPEALTADRQFARTAANRVWALYLGRGLVHPVDMDHPDNPPSHPALLDRLTEEFQASKYDLRALTRAVVLSETYQRSSVPPAGKDLDPKQFAVAPLRPLTPEQLAWSLMQATGQIEAERRALGPKGTGAALAQKLAAQAAPVVQLFGQPPGEPTPPDFEAVLGQALFLNNGALLRGWLAPRPGNLMDRLAQLKEADAIADELYVSILSRPPAADERREVADYLARRGPERGPALQELAWALLTSTEFRFNH